MEVSVIYHIRPYELQPVGRQTRSTREAFYEWLCCVQRK